jgi:hypothetical protein
VQLHSNENLKVISESEIKIPKMMPLIEKEIKK